MDELHGEHADTSSGSDNSTLDFRELELGVFFGNNDITVKDHLSPSTESTAVDCRDDRFVERVSSRDRAETMRHCDQFFLIIGDLGAEAGVVSSKPAREGWESRWR